MVLALGVTELVWPSPREYDGESALLHARAAVEIYQKVQRTFSRDGLRTRQAA